MSKWQGSAPSNIAMIKYMGKKGTAADPNQPMNPSLSWTIDHLRTFVEIETRDDLKEDIWEIHPEYTAFALKSGKQTKFLNHFLFLKKTFEIEDRFFVVRSGNNFPADCGIASSASSFAALTRCAVAAFEDLRKEKKLSSKAFSAADIAQLSRQGSGSSCRSLFPGWVEWNGSVIQSLESPLKDILHTVIVVSEEAKTISSSLAHKMVSSSLLMRGRRKRAQIRFDEFKKELSKQNYSWESMYQLAWAETWDMHALFETSQPSFGYMNRHSIRVLNKIRKMWESKRDGPIVTMDAGPNIHLLWRVDQLELAVNFKKKFEGEYLFISDSRLD